MLTSATLAVAGWRDRTSQVNGEVRLSFVTPSKPDLPCGLHPRLIQTGLKTKTLLCRERAFFVGESTNGFLALMGIADNGGVNGGLTRGREQLRRLCLASFSYHDRTLDRGGSIVIAD